ncbi:hypothetical protein AAX22_06670 [Oenococcus oeni]|nr:hypothetical protein AAX22_06670 [Oenococcus oeni]
MNKNEQVNISIPKRAFDKLYLNNGGKNKLLARIDHNRIILQAKETKTEAQTQSLRWFMVPGLLAGFVALVNFFIQKTDYVKLSGANSISQITIYLAALFGFITFFNRIIVTRQKTVGHYKSISKISLNHNSVDCVYVA